MLNTHGTELAVILSAGKGERLEPISTTIPKPLIPIAGQPLLDFIIQDLSKLGVRKFVIVVGHQMDEIEAHYKTSNYDIKTIVQKKQLGTGDALRAAKKEIDCPSFIVLNGDVLISYQDLKRFISSSGSGNTGFNTIAGAEVQKSAGFGVLEIQDDHLIDIHEKTDKPPSNVINAGLYFFHSHKILEILDDLTQSSRGEYELTDSISNLIALGEKFQVIRLKDPWLDVGRPWDLLTANRIKLERTTTSIEGEVQEGAKLNGKIFVGKNALIRSGTYIDGPCFIDEDASVGPNCYIRPHTYIGKRVHIGNAVEIKNAIILDGTNIGHLAYVGDSVIGRNCNLGAGTKGANLRLDDKHIKMMIKGKTESSGTRKLGFFMGDSVKTGINASIMPGVKIGPNSAIGAHILITKDVPPGELWTIDPKSGNLVIRKWNY